MTSSAAASDPNGWVSNPPSVLVKVVNTTRDTLNGKMGVVLGYDQTRTRYVIHLTVSQQQVALKAENLIKASWMEQMRGQVELLQNNADIQQQIMQFTQRIQTATGGRLNIQKVAMLLGVTVLLMIYWIGFSKTLLLLSFFILMAIIMAPDLKSNNVTLRQVLQNLPMRVRTVIREQVPYYGNAIADNNLYTAALVGLVLAFFVNAMIQGKVAPRAASPAATSEPSWLSPNRLLEKLGLASGGNGANSGNFGTSSAVVNDGGSTMNTVLDASSSPIVRPYISKKGLLEDAYKRGFEDATSQKEFGTSLEELLQRQEERMHAAEFHDLPAPIISPPPLPRSTSSSMMSASSLFSILYIARTLYSAGQTADHHGFDVQLMIANLRTMDTIRLAMLGFSIYRLVAPFL